MNAPDRMDAIRVPEGMEKSVIFPGQLHLVFISLTYYFFSSSCRIFAKVEEKVTSACNYTIAREDHTVGNLLRMELLQDQRVRFSGYKHPHPLENDIILRIQTHSGVHPTQVLVEATKRLEDNFRLMYRMFITEATRLSIEAERLDYE
jgi:DNA-directed RNA polymerase II subunit RPB11